MKKALLFFCLISVLSAGFSQEIINPADTILPEKIVKDFTKRFPKQNPEEWVKDVNKYIITFYEKNEWFDVSYSDKGKWIETAVLIDYDALPESVRNSFEKSSSAYLDLIKINLIEKPKLPKVYSLFLEDKKGNEVILKYNDKGEKL